MFFCTFNVVMIGKSKFLSTHVYVYIYAYSYHSFLNYRFREYGLWSRYADLYPEDDLVYTIGSSNYTKDWFFAHVTRYVI